MNKNKDHKQDPVYPGIYLGPFQPCEMDSFFLLDLRAPVGFIVYDSHAVSHQHWYRIGSFHLLPSVFFIG